MTNPIHPSVIPVQSHHSHSQDRKKRLENSCTKSGKGAHLTEHDVLADMVVRALWAEFPATSEFGVADQARHYFRDKRGEPVSLRTIQNWLRKDNLPSAAHFAALMVMQPAIFLSQLLGRGE